tara:strand:- start:387 stop:842 length:456 start_codon:yes stop_codon:yes gene_type:complete
MEFPEELWNLIFSYFHSAYKKPTHYDCIMENHDFYYIRKHNKNLVNTLPYRHMLSKQAQNHNSVISKKKNKEIAGYIFGNNKDLLRYTGSYYMKIMLATNLNTTSKNIIKFKNRGVAIYTDQNILKEFIDIIEIYKNNTFMINSYSKLSYI